MKKILLCALLALTTISCTENSRAKSFGGKMTVDLPQGEKLIEATWKEGDLWYLTRPRRANETTETYIFREESSFGVMEGTVIFKEQ